MTFEQLHYIIEIQKCGTILAAAKKLNVSPPAVSKAVSNLEKELQLNLFIRNNSGTYLTEDGEKVLQIAKQILSLSDALYDISSSKSHYHLQIEVYPQEIMEFAPELIASFKEKFQHSELSFSQTSISHIVDQLDKEKIDMGIFSLVTLCKPLLKKSIRTHSLITTKLCVLINANNALSAHEFLTPEDISEQSIILPDDDMVATHLQELFYPAAFPHQLLRTNDQILMKKMVLNGSAIGTCSELMQYYDPNVQSGQMVLCPLQCNGAFLTMEYLYAYNSKKQLNPAEKALIAHLRALLHSFNASL